MEALDLRYRYRQATLHGQQITVVEYEIPDSAPDLVKEGLSRRMLVGRGETCPCGAEMVLPPRAARRRAARRGQVLDVEIVHRPDCEARLPGYLLMDCGRWDESA